MRKPVALLVAAALLTVAAAGYAATQTGKSARKTRTKAAVPAASIAKKASPKALVTLDYFNLGSAAFYYWGGPNYMSNIFQPGAGDYPLDVVSAEVYYAALDDVTTTGAAGTIDGVRVFDPAGAILASQLGVPGLANSWNTVTFTTPPTIAAGTFLAGGFNSYVSSTDRNDGMLQGSAQAWTGPPTEPFRMLDAGTAATAGSPGPWTVMDSGAAWATTSAASIRVTINTNVPVELMRFDAE